MDQLVHLKQDVNSFIIWKAVQPTCWLLGKCHTFTAFISAKETLFHMTFHPTSQPPNSMYIHNHHAQLRV